MPFEIVRNDIVHMWVDAIVNSANPRPVVGLGTDSSIHEKAGPELLQARQEIGPIAPGQAAVTPAFRLNAKYVIHTVGPVWEGGGYAEEEILRSCYDRSLVLAKDHACRSIAFPLIATNNYGFPREKALRIALAAFSDFLLENEMQIYLVVFDRESFGLSEKLMRNIASFIDDHYVECWEEAVYGSHQDYRRQIPDRMAADRSISRNTPVRREGIPCPSGTPKKAPPVRETPAPSSLDELADVLKQVDAGFTETLLRYIDQSGKKDSEIYKKANLSKQHFSKIRSNPHYKPTKQTALALAIALELDMDKTRDLIGRAGYTLTGSSKFDLIVRYFIEHGIYDLYEINLALFEFDQSLLGA